MPDIDEPLDPHVADLPASLEPPPRLSEDWLAVMLGGLVLAVVAGVVWFFGPATFGDRVHNYLVLQRSIAEQEDAADTPKVRAANAKILAREKKEIVGNPISSWVGKPGGWERQPLEAFQKGDELLLGGIFGAFLVSIALFSLGVWMLRQHVGRFATAFCLLFGLAILAYLLAGHVVIEHYNLEYVLWALLIGLVISNTVGTPVWLRSAVRTELYIKTGLVLLGAEILFSELLALGLPGICIAWIVTPIVLISTYLFGQHVLKLPSRSLNMVISADMSVCGVSAAIATAAACKAKKEELSLAIAMSLIFTVAMMVIMPPVILQLGLGPVVGGAWMGGTIDSTGAVAAAGELLGESSGSAALTVAATIKMIQNILIGVVAFAVAVYWVSVVERSSPAAGESGGPVETPPRSVGIGEIWKRFPKFVLGFVAASILFSLAYASGLVGESFVENVTGTTKGFRGWFFCLAFVSIGLETRFKQLASQLSGGKPLILYLCGQTLNLCLTLAMAWLMFEVVFPDVAQSLQ